MSNSVKARSRIQSTTSPVVMPVMSFPGRSRGGGKGARHHYGSSLFDGFPLTDRCGIKVRQASSSRQLQSGP